MIRAWLVTAVMLIVGTSCATKSVPPLVSSGTMHLAEDERRLWREAEKEQTRLDGSDRIYEGSQLLTYLNSVAARVLHAPAVPEGLELRVGVIKDSHLNAFSYPNGVIYFHTGLLAALENEAQFAAILGHEIVHVTHRHLLQQFRTTKNTAAFAKTLQVLAAPAGIYGSGALILGSIGAMAALSGYSQETEREADEVGLELMVRAGYDPAEAPRSFAHLRRELEAEERSEPFFFASHPRLAAREENYRRLLTVKYPDVEGMIGRERYINAIAPVFLDNVLMDVSLGRFGLAQHSLQGFLQHWPEDARAYYCLGELHRRRGAEGDLASAQAAYRRAIEHEPNLPEPHRGLGLLFLKQQRLSDAEREFLEYLKLAPDASDRAYIQAYLARLSNTERRDNNDF